MAEIPEDLQPDYSMTTNPDECWGPTFVRELIERIAKAEAESAEKDRENAEFERNFSKRESHWIRENAQQQQTIATLRQRIEEMGRPVTKEEQARYFGEQYGHSENEAWLADINALHAARASTTPKAGRADEAGEGKL